jgi:hypothetical protein
MDQAVTFRDLRSSDPKAPEQLAERVRRSALAWFPDCAETNGIGRRLVIGVAVWSNYDLRLLDLVNEAVTAGKQPDLHVAVFNIDELSSPAELQRIFPGIGEVFQTPAVGYWEAGQLKETASGFAGRQLVGRLLGFDPKLVLEQSAAAAG